jgi:hypothetical protein
MDVFSILLFVIPVICRRNDAPFCLFGPMTPGVFMSQFSFQHICYLHSQPQGNAPLKGTVYLECGKTLDVTFRTQIHDEGEAAELVTTLFRRKNLIKQDDVVGCLVVPIQSKQPVVAVITPSSSVISNLADLIEPHHVHSWH